MKLIFNFFSLFQAGIIEEMMEDTMEMMEDDDELEEDVQNAVDQILNEAVSGKISKPKLVPEASISLPEVGTGTVPVEPEPEEEEEQEVEEDLEEMQSRLQALRS